MVPERGLQLMAVRSNTFTALSRTKGRCSWFVAVVCLWLGAQGLAVQLGTADVFVSKVGDRGNDLVERDLFTIVLHLEVSESTATSKSYQTGQLSSLH